MGLRVFLFVILGFFAIPQLMASQLVYTPVNPSFAGSALNGSMLLNSAQAQNTIKDPDLEEEEETALGEFNERLQRSLLSRLTSSIASSFVSNDGSLIPGQTITDDFVIDITDEGGGTVRVTTTDRVSGDSTTFIIQAQSF